MRDGIPGLSVAVFSGVFFSFLFFSFLSFVLFFPFSCTHLGGEKRFRGVYTLTGVMGEEVTERDRSREWSSFVGENEKIKF